MSIILSWMPSECLFLIRSPSSSAQGRNLARDLSLFLKILLIYFWLWSFKFSNPSNNKFHPSKKKFHLVGIWLWRFKFSDSGNKKFHFPFIQKVPNLQSKIPKERIWLGTGSAVLTQWQDWSLWEFSPEAGALLSSRESKTLGYMSFFSWVFYRAQTLSHWHSWRLLIFNVLNFSFS